MCLVKLFLTFRQTLRIISFEEAFISSKPYVICSLKIMQVFPEEMRGDIALHINREILSLPMFKTASIGCQKSIAQLIGTRFSTPGEFLVHRGDAIRYIYFVCSGSLEILDEEGSVVALLGT